MLTAWNMQHGTYHLICFENFRTASCQFSFHLDSLGCGLLQLYFFVFVLYDDFFGNKCLCLCVRCGVICTTHLQERIFGVSFDDSKVGRTRGI